jgi:hypothetical protein
LPSSKEHMLTLFFGCQEPTRVVYLTKPLAWGEDRCPELSKVHLEMTLGLLEQFSVPIGCENVSDVI